MLSTESVWTTDFVPPLLYHITCKIYTVIWFLVKTGSFYTKVSIESRRVCTYNFLYISQPKHMFLNQNICCGYSKEPSQWDGSFEHPKHMVKIIGKKIFTILRWKFLLILTCDHTVTLYPPLLTNRFCGLICLYTLVAYIANNMVADQTATFGAVWFANLLFAANIFKTNFICMIRVKIHSPYMGLNAKKSVFGGLRTTKAQNSLRIHADWSAPSLFAFWKLSYLNLLQVEFQFSSYM